MKIIEPSVELIDDIDTEDVYIKIERCGRVCYQSQPPPPIVINEGDFSREEIAKISTEPLPLKNLQPRTEHFIRMLIKRGHESVLEHVSLTFHIICDRAIMAELTRHRLASFSVESTRYVKYDELTFVNPPPYVQEDLRQAELAYEDALNGGLAPEQARAVLPLCTKTELYMTANLREWRHVLKLRTAPSAHPQMRLIANQILNILRDKLPVIVEDIGGKQHEDND